MLDIDKFLEEEIKKFKEKKSLKLDFQYDVELTLDSFKKEISNSSLNDLSKIYKEVLKFDKDLNNKFISINSETTKLLNKTAQNFYEKVYIEQKTIYENNKISFNKNIKKLKDSLEKKDIFNGILHYENAKRNLQNYPNSFFDKKYEDFKTLETCYSVLLNLLKNYTKSLKEDLNHKIILKLKEISVSINKNNYVSLKEKIIEMEKLIKNIPNYIHSDFFELEQKAIHYLKIAKEKVFNFEKNFFLEHEKSLFLKIDLFYQEISRKNVKSAIILYNSIVEDFSKIPNIFLEKKKELLKKITKCFSTLNSAIINYNISFITSNYYLSKIISHFEDYYYFILENPDYYSKEKVNKIILSLNKINDDYSLNIKKKFEGLLKKYENNILVSKKENYKQNFLTINKRKKDKKTDESKSINLKKINNFHKNLEKLIYKIEISTTKEEVENSYNVLIKLLKSKSLSNYLVKEKKENYILKVKNLRDKKLKELEKRRQKKTALKKKFYKNLEIIINQIKISRTKEEVVQYYKKFLILINLENIGIISNDEKNDYYLKIKKLKDKKLNEISNYGLKNRDILKNVEKYFKKMKASEDLEKILYYFYVINIELENLKLNHFSIKKIKKSLNNIFVYKIKNYLEKNEKNLEKEMIEKFIKNLKVFLESYNINLKINKELSDEILIDLRKNNFSQNFKLVFQNFITKYCLKKNEVIR